jgi:hypothetical protein
MKISTHVTKNLSANQFKKNGMQPAPIPYDRQERSKNKDKEDMSIFRIRTNPTDKDSQTYDMKVLTFHTGTVKEFLLWKKDLNKVLVGQNVLSAPDKFAMTRRLLDGDALAAFNTEASACSQETNVNYIRCMQALSTHVFPKNALTIQRQWFHRYLHKRVENSMREFVARINEINAMMEEFPPGFKKSQMINDSEMKDLLEFAIPISWRVKMAEHAFRPIEHSVPDIVEFCERLEFTENATKSILNNGGNHQNQTQSQSNNKGKNSEQGQKSQDNVDALTHATSKQRTNKHKRPGKVVSYKDSNGSDGCRLHIWATDHTTAECRVIQKQIDGMRAQYEAQPHNANKRQKINNNKPKQGGDLHVLLTTFNDVKKRIEKELNQRSMTCGKRKVSLIDDIVIDKQENKNIDSKNITENITENFSSELEELTLSDVSDGDFEMLSDISELE